MADTISREQATNVAGTVHSLPSLTLDECIDTAVWLVQNDSTGAMAKFARSVTGSVPGIGEMVSNGELRLVRYSPDELYVLFASGDMPALAPEWKAYVTDIGHGICDLNLKGNNALNFIGDYVSADLKNHEKYEAQTLRCRIGQFKVLLWWADMSDIHILVDRSMSQSFCDYLMVLSQRWSPYRPNRPGFQTAEQL